ncbi:MAG TPA: hypothetical protein DEQ02_06860, partial [Ruminococcaceae bacterium]|nr:hypothetical protein [Oscillospiraceae bacterium]
NLGESDASNVVISDVLPAGTELATGETGFIQIDGVDVPNGVYSYNTATRALSVNIGGG